MLRFEPSNKPAIELPINVDTECKNFALPAWLSRLSAVEIASRCLYLNVHSTGSLGASS